MRKRIRKVDSVMQENPDGIMPSGMDDIDRIIGGYKEKVRSPLTGIRAHCVECFGGFIKGVSECTATGCALWPFRMGKNTMHALRGVTPKTAKGKSK